MAEKRMMKKSSVDVKIIYEKYSANGVFMGEREYIARSRQDYFRVWEIITENPDEYKLVNCEY